MKQKMQGLAAGILIGAVLTGGAAIAKNESKFIEAFYSNIKIFVDGTQIEPKDVNGTKVEPFIYNGTTYLPVRAVGEAIGKDVVWDAETNSVYLTEPKKTETLDEEITEKPETPKAEQPEKPGETRDITTKKILQISGYNEEDIKGNITLSWTEGTKNAEFLADLKCNNGGLADYALCKIELTETISSTKNQIDGYFKVTINDKTKYEKLSGKITVTDTEIILHTQEYDYNLKAVFAEKLEEKTEENISFMMFDALSLDGEKASGLFGIEFNKEKADIQITGEFSIGENKYTLTSNAINSVTESEITAVFTVMCNNEEFITNKEGKIKNLNAKLGETVTLQIENFGLLELRLTEIAH